MRTTVRSTFLHCDKDGQNRLFLLRCHTKKCNINTELHLWDILDVKIQDQTCLNVIEGLFHSFLCLWRMMKDGIIVKIIEHNANLNIFPENPALSWGAHVIFYMFDHKPWGLSLVHHNNRRYIPDSASKYDRDSCFLQRCDFSTFIITKPVDFLPLFPPVMLIVVSLHTSACVFLNFRISFCFVPEDLKVTRHASGVFFLYLTMHPLFQSASWNLVCLRASPMTQQKRINSIQTHRSAVLCIFVTVQ